METGFIVDRMISAMKDSGIEVIACYSRSLEKAKEFCEKHQMKRYYSKFRELLKDEEVDTIYVASPNSLTFILNQRWLYRQKNMS